MSRRLRLASLVGAVLAAGSPALPSFAAPPAAPAGPSDLAPAAEAARQRLKELLAGEAGRSVGGEMLDLAALRRLYEARNFEPVWLTSSERVATLAAIFTAAGDHGIELGLPTAAFPLPGRGAGISPAERELLLTHLALRYATQLAVGRVRPEQFETDWSTPAPVFDAVGGLQKALHGNRLAAWFDSIPPTHIGYHRLKAALSRYRELAKAGGWQTIKSGPSIKPGMDDPRVPALRERLIVEGDLLPADAAEGETLDPALEQAVRRFQARHGIVPDGAIGPKTLGAMNVSAKARIEQIALNLERWRSVPRDWGRDAILVNVPAASLEVVENGATIMTMKTVVGTPDNPTPVLQTGVAAIVVNPYWTIPNSIYTKEIRPKLKQDPLYLEKNQMVRSPEKGLQQLPGPKNPLGRIKFETPNRYDVYLHDTPSRGTFERFVRAQSHGCVRMEKARDLAAYILQAVNIGGDELDRVVASGETQRIELKHRWRVHLQYWTAFADADGTVEFRDDIYGRDKRLHAALLGLPAAAPEPMVTAAKASVGLDAR
jgi:L,D-transpeptidase YcbB